MYKVEGNSKARWTYEVNLVLCMINSGDKIENSQAMMGEVNEMGSKRGKLERGSRARNEAKRARGKNKRGNRCVGVEVRMGMYGTQGVRQGKGAEQKSRYEGEGGCMRGWWYKDDWSETLMERKQKDQMVV